MNRESMLKLVLWAIALYHVVLGASAFLSADLAQRIARSVFGLEITLDPSMAFVTKVLGIYALTFGAMAFVAARDPARHRALLDLVVLLYVLRVANKILFKTELIAGFQVSPTRVWVESALLAGFALAVFLLRPRGRPAR